MQGLNVSVEHCPKCSFRLRFFERGALVARPRVHVMSERRGRSTLNEVTIGDSGDSDTILFKCHRFGERAPVLVVWMLVSDIDVLRLFCHEYSILLWRQHVENATPYLSRSEGGCR